MIRKFSVIISVLLVALFSSSAFAEWYTQKVYVKRVEHFLQSGTNVIRVIYETNTNSLPPSFTCVPSSMPIDGYPNRYQASYWNGSMDLRHQTLQAQLLAAQALVMPVDIYFETSGCDTNSSMGYGGLGRKMVGVSISQD